MRLISFILILLLAGSAYAETDVHLRVTTEGRILIRIGFAEPQKPIGDAAKPYHEQFIEVLRKDLDISGYFDIVGDVKKDEPHAIITVATRADGSSLSFDVDLSDRSSGQTIFKHNYGASPERITDVAHIVADDIVFALTGMAGIANTRLAFVAGEKGSSHLYVTHIDGSGLQRVSGTPGIVMSPSWSPDGKRVAYVSYEDGNSAVYVVDIPSLDKTKFASFEGMNATPAWSPDGRKLALTLSKDGNPEIYIISLDGKTRKRITYYSGIDCSPTWAPNGLELAFTSDRTGTPQIFVTDVEGLNVRRVTEEGGYNTSPAWSPEGDLIAYVSRIDGSFQICTVDPFGMSVNVLTDRGSNEDPSWSPEGMHIVFSSTAGRNSGIYVMNKDGSNRRRVVEGMKQARNPAWASQPAYGRPTAIDG
jgi:TolB protein